MCGGPFQGIGIGSNVQQLSAQQNAMIASLAASNMMGGASLLGFGAGPAQLSLNQMCLPNTNSGLNSNNNLSMAIAAQMLVLQNMQGSMGLQQAMQAFNNAPAAITAGNLSFADSSHGMGFGGASDIRGPSGGLYGGFTGGGLRF
jgi:hypothetical protein